MSTRMIFPLSGLVVLAVAVAVSPSPAFATDAQHCNNEVCEEFFGSQYCKPQTGGPNTHCIQAGSVCAWDFCDD